ncbi:DUF2518 family protein [Cyanobium gracile]|uniref:DUF2518 family protein n=1 Tax=Cyanobium gracile UHCC 0281 TaxID=3110309 RepID=A0ABU5T054_9CYAN|nr:DUF2518 family protein [Cyanobium gracile]MEA5444160.1 DUF2518 family protein [Cyanobium gracile UHCC 0281]
MAADPILLVAGTWLGAASGVLAVLTIAGFLSRWGIRFRLVGITSFTALLSLSCLAFAISYNPRVSVPGAVQVPVVFDNGTDLVIAAAPADLEIAAAAPTVEQVARNLRGGGRGGSGADGGAQVWVRLRRVEAVEPGLARPVVLAETTREQATSSLDDAV